VTDYRRFLAAATEEVLPYFGGPFVETGRRRLRLEGSAEPGYWRFSVAGRTARPLAPADAVDLGHLPAVRGYALAGYLVASGGRAERLALPPGDEPLPFTPMVARRWPTGELLFEAWDFESGVEDEVRGVFERRETLAAVRGAPAELRAAFGYAVLLRTAEESGIRARPAEVRAHLASLADEGEPAARRILGRLQVERSRRPGPAGTRDAAGREADAAPIRGPGDAPVGGRVGARTEERAAEALHAARAGLRNLRWLADGLLELRYDLDGERFVSIVETDTLRVVDAGICLDGADRELTLESLPSVIREAMRTHRLVLTSR
jgi:hypothetical protein